MAAGDEHDNGANGPDGGDHDEQPYEFDDDVFRSSRRRASRRVIIKTFEGATEGYEDGLENQFDEAFLEKWAEVMNNYETELTIRRAFRTVEGDDDHYRPTLRTYYEVLLPSDRGPAAYAVADMLRKADLPQIELVYVESPPAPPPNQCGGRNRFYLDDAPRGMGVNPPQGAGGDPWPLVVVMESVWQPGHPELADVWSMGGFEGPQGVTEYANLPTESHHATATLGVLAAAGLAGGPGCLGMLPPKAAPGFATTHIFDESIGEWVEDLKTQMVAVATNMSAGDILLIERQIWGRRRGTCGPSLPGEHDKVLSPLELEPHLRDALEQVRDLDIIAIVAAGNGSTAGGVRLDETAIWDGEVCRLMPGDSAAILVAACDTVRANGVHARLPQSNFGAQAVCYAWGNNVVTLDSNNHSGTWTYRDTSAASALLAGVAARVQSRAMATLGRRLTPAEMRAALTFTPPGAVAPGRGLNIGVMPNMDDIFAGGLPAA